MSERFKKTRMLTTLSVLAALAIVLVLVIPPFTIFPTIKDLKYDFMDIPFLLAGFAYGPIAGLAVVVVAATVQGLTVSADGGLVGIAMHIIASGTLVVVSSLIYRKMHNIKGAIIGLIAGMLSMTAIMIPANLLITAPYYGIPVKAIVSLLPLIIAFNLIKAGANSFVTFFIYKPLRKFIMKKPEVCQADKTEEE